MPQVAIVFSGTQDVLTSNYSAVATAITNSGLSVVPGPIPVGNDGVAQDTSTLLSYITNFRIFVRIVLTGTQAQYAALISSLQTIKAGSPGLSFSVAFNDASAV